MYLNFSSGIEPNARVMVSNCGVRPRDSISTSDSDIYSGVDLVVSSVDVGRKAWLGEKALTNLMDDDDATHSRNALDNLILTFQSLHF